MAAKTITAAHFSPDIQSFIALLHKHDVRYLIVGGEAVIFYGHVRLTGDVDFFYDKTKKNAENLYKALDEFWESRIPFVEKVEDLLQADLVLQYGIPPNRIDLINSAEALHFNDAWLSRIEIQIIINNKKVPLYYIGLDDLIINKKAVNRPKDQDDLNYLYAAGLKKEKGQREKGKGLFQDKRKKTKDKKSSK
jgi:hypothetical protein